MPSLSAQIIPTVAQFSSSSLIHLPSYDPERPRRLLQVAECVSIRLHTDVLSNKLIESDSCVNPDVSPFSIPIYSIPNSRADSILNPDPATISHGLPSRVSPCICVIFHLLTFSAIVLSCLLCDVAIFGSLIYYSKAGLATLEPM